MAERKRDLGASDLPVQPVEQPILCNPYDEPTRHWACDADSGETSLQPKRRPAPWRPAAEVH